MSQSRKAEANLVFGPGGGSGSGWRHPGPGTASLAERLGSKAGLFGGRRWGKSQGSQVDHGHIERRPDEAIWWPGAKARERSRAGRKLVWVRERPDDGAGVLDVSRGPEAASWAGGVARAW